MKISLFYKILLYTKNYNNNYFLFWIIQDFSNQIKSNRIYFFRSLDYKTLYKLNVKNI